MTARRPLLTAAAAGSVLLALWFVPSANATVERRAEARQSAAQVAGTAGRTGPEAQQSGARQAQVSTGTQDGTGVATQGTGTADELALADSGSIDTTPYAVGGTAFLGIGAALVTVAVRRSRGETA